MGPLGIQEMVFIFVFALIIFGPKKLPELGRTFGKGMAEFRRASNELKSTFQREMDNIERETKVDEARKAAADAKKAITDATYYDDSEQDYYDAYDYDGVKTTSESAPSTGGSTDSASSAETPSNDSSSGGVQTAEAMKPETDAGNAAEKAPEKGAA